MIKELKLYVQVLKDRVRLFKEYENICANAGDQRGMIAYSTGACDISDIISELTSFVNRQEAIWGIDGIPGIHVEEGPDGL